MATATDELRLKVSWDEYSRRIGVLDGKIREMQTLIGEYGALRDRSISVLGEDDTNLRDLQNSVDKNIKAVQGQMEELNKSRDMLQRQMDNLTTLSGDVGTMFRNATDTAVSAFRAVKAVSDMVE